MTNNDEVTGEAALRNRVARLEARVQQLEDDMKRLRVELDRRILEARKNRPN